MMNSIDFCYWLQGNFELNPDAPVTPEQIKIIKNHLNLVFKHEIDPLREGETITPASALNHAHSGKNDSLIRC